MSTNGTSQADDNGKLLRKAEHLMLIGAQLSTENNLETLLEAILTGAMELTDADGGSLYILEERTLSFSLIHTSSLNLHMGGSSESPITFPSIPLEHADGSPNLNTIVTSAVHEKRLINIPDAYKNTEYDFSGTHEFDRNTGYHSQSFLAMPMQDHEGNIIGVLQLLNATDQNNAKVVPFSSEDEQLIAALAAQAAVAINQKRLIEGMENLLASLVRLIATAIDEKSPHTAGHCRRVPEITMDFARAINNCSETYGNLSFDEKQMKELEMAAWMHDCGKIATPEHLIDKRTKLQTVVDRIELVDARIEIMRRDAEIALLRSSTGQSQPQAVAECRETLDKLAAARTFLHRCNTGGEFLRPEDRQQITELADLTLHVSDAGEKVCLLDQQDVKNLLIPRGTLNDEERKIINNHIVSTINMLEELPFPAYLSNVPLIAGGHHERMDGKGYPRGIPAAELPIQSRILTIADVFEALTASDRAYRRPNSLKEALTIMGHMCREGHFDPELFTFFIRERVYLPYAKRHMVAERIENVDPETVLALFA
ncbi:MAG: phosphohydrolase [Desulfuromonas sp.]|nr:MAG: phosphohydrolase [Desulfuromonas sp.]